MAPGPHGPVPADFRPCRRRRRPGDDATRDYREENDAIRRFIDDCCDTQFRDAIVPAAALFGAYQVWCDSKAIKPVPGTAFRVRTHHARVPGRRAEDCHQIDKDSAPYPAPWGRLRP